jgi:hypothetical protein
MDVNEAQEREVSFLASIHATFLTGSSEVKPSYRPYQNTRQVSYRLIIPFQNESEESLSELSSRLAWAA